MQSHWAYHTANGAHIDPTSSAEPSASWYLLQIDIATRLVRKARDPLASCE